MVIQTEITLPSFPRGYHLVTAHLMGKLPQLPKTGLIHLFIRHTSAALTLNENADPTVRHDFERFLNRLIPDADRSFTHLFEGPDDMSAHLKASLLGASVTIPIVDGKPGLGTWQGVYLCEFRHCGGPRQIVVTITGE